MVLSQFLDYLHLVCVLSAISLLGKYQGYTLTLAGIAGIIVSIGLAADSYIVTFEKFKDELKIEDLFNMLQRKL